MYRGLQATGLTRVVNGTSEAVASTVKEPLGRDELAEPGCPTGYYCEAMIDPQSLTVAWTGPALTAAVGTVIYLFGKATRGKGQPRRLRDRPLRLLHRLVLNVGRRVQRICGCPGSSRTSEVQIFEPVRA